MEVYWLEQADADVPGGDDWLSTREIACLARLRFPKRRADWRLGRWTAKRAVASCLKMPWSPADVEVRAALSGAPEVYLGWRRAEVTISISHRSGLAACGVTRTGASLGCDLEMIEPHSNAFAAEYFTEEEQRLVEGAGVGRDGLLTLLWSAKESALKAIGEGLRLDTRCVSVRLDGWNSPGEGFWQPMEVDHAGGIFHGWWQRTGDIVRTLVSSPACGSPIWL